VYVRFVVQEAALGLIFPSAVQFPQSISFNERSTSICTYAVLLTEGQKGEAWKPPKKQCFFGTSGGFE
jgi:hypothetical protein